MTALPLRPALADVLAAVTDEPRGHWIARFADPSLRGELFFVRARPDRLDVALHFAVDPHRAPVRDVRTPITATSPAEAFETLCARGVLPDAWAGDVRRFFRCSCDGKREGAPKGKGGQVVWNCPRCEDFADERPQFTIAHPPTIPALVAWASLGPAAILRAEELARETVRRLRPWGAPQTERVVWHVRQLSTSEEDGAGCAWSDDAHDGDHALESGGQSPAGDFVEQAHDVWEMGLVIASITADAVTIVVPPIGGAP